MTSKEISHAELTASLDRREPLVLLEALPPQHFANGHLPGARNLPHDQVAALAPRVAPDKDAAIVVYCASRTCRNSHLAAGLLGKLGYANVRVYAGGKEEWQMSGRALEGAAA